MTIGDRQTTYRVRQHENGRWQWGVVLDASEAWSEPLAIGKETAVRETEVHSVCVLADYWRSVPLPDGHERTGPCSVTWGVGRHHRIATSEGGKIVLFDAYGRPMEGTPPQVLWPWLLAQWELAKREG